MANLPDLNDDPPADAPAEESLRDALDAAFQEHASDEAEEPRVTSRERDDLGRFARKGDDPEGGEKAPSGPQEPAKGAQAPAGAPAIPAAPQPAEFKPPASWTPAARELWAQVPEGVRSEIHRREVEAQRLLQDTAGLRDFARQFQDTVRPYEMFIRQEQSTPMQAVQGLLNTAATMRMGSAQDKATLVADIIQRHAVDIRLLDSILDRVINGGGQQPGGGGNIQPQQFHDPRFDLFLQQQAQERQQREAWETNAMRSGLAAFAESHEFYRDVAGTMADLVDIATRKGEGIDLEKIYQRACQLDESVSSILSQRNAAAASRPQGTSQAVLRAKRAAVSVKGEPTPEGAMVPKNDTVRASIEAAIDSLSQ